MEMLFSFRITGTLCWSALHWRHNDHDGVSNYQPHGCLLNRLLRRRSKKIPKVRVTGLCWGKFTGYAENISIWWRHHGNQRFRRLPSFGAWQAIEQTAGSPVIWDYAHVTSLKWNVIMTFSTSDHHTLPSMLTICMPAVLCIYYILRHIIVSTLARVMACCHRATSNSMNQGRLIMCVCSRCRHNTVRYTTILH